MTHECGSCGLPSRPYHPETGKFVAWETVDLGKRFRIPDLHGGYGRCCRKTFATFEMIDMAEVDPARIFGGHDHGIRCVDCRKTVAFSDTMVQWVEVTS